MKRSALCLVDTEAQADAVVGKLRSAGFSDNDISVLFPDKGSTRDFAHKKATKMPEGATVGASTGGVRRASARLASFCARSDRKRIPCKGALYVEKTQDNAALESVT